MPTSTSNPLLDSAYLPKFKAITAEDCLPAVEHVIEGARQTVSELEKIAHSATWENFADKLETMEESIDRVWSTISHLNGVDDSAELRDAYQACIQVLTVFHTELGQNETLFKGYKHIKASADFDTLNQAKRKIIDNTIRDFVLSGAELDDAKKARFAEISLEQSKLSNQFSQNILDSTQAWHLDITDEADLAGLPDSAKSLAKQTAQAADLNNSWRFGLDYPSYSAILTYADNAELREKMYKAYATRASEFGDEKLDNGPLIKTIVDLKQEKAELLGYKTYAELALVTKMTESPKQVTDFLDELLTYAKPKAEKDLQELQTFASEHYDADNLAPWDLGYYSEKLKEHAFNFDSEEVKQYFPIDKVFEGMFEVASRLFGVNIKKNTDIDTWQDDVISFDVSNDNDELIGQLFSDLYVRKGKRGGAWMAVCRHKRTTPSVNQLPVAYLTCNFTPASDGKPALLTHDEVETLFHEFGHTLHHLLTKVNEMSVAGINGVAWDAVELPSQFLENWCWHKESIPLISEHYATGEPLPEELLNKMLAAKTFQSGLACVRQVEFSLFDILLFSGYKLNTSKDVQTLLDTVRKKTAVISPPDYHRFQNSFSHIFAGGYSAGYYSYKWSEVLSADAFSRFEEEGVFNEQTGQSFLENILQRGGEDEPGVLFEKFRGRQPSITPLLQHSNLVAN